MAERSSRTTAIAGLILVAGSVLFALALGEAVLRLTGKFQPNAYPPKCPMPDMLEAHETYGYRLTPSRRMTYSYPAHHPRTVSFVSNSDGFRAKRELGTPDATVRMAFLGDSFVIGLGVEEEERFTNLLESFKPEWRIDNMGMVGYGPDLMVRAFEALGPKLKPTIAVLCMYTDDFRRVVPEYAGTGFLIPRYELRSGQLVTVPYPTPTFWNQLSIAVALRKALFGRTSLQPELNAAILDRFRELAKKYGAEAAIVFLPGRRDSPPDYQRRTWLAEYARRRSTPYLDLTGAVHAAGDAVFIKGNTHLNPAGHELVARHLRNFLEGESVFKLNSTQTLAGASRD